MANEILEVKHLSKSFGSNVVLRDIDFAVSKGDVISIIGASGSGKSTLLRCINLLETPTHGEIWYDGKNVADRKVKPHEYRSRVGMVFQSFNLFNNMTVLKNCMVGQMKVLGRKKEEARESRCRIRMWPSPSPMWWGNPPCTSYKRWVWPPTSMPSPGSCPAVRSSVWPSPVRWQ